MIPKGSAQEVNRVAAEVGDKRYVLTRDGEHSRIVETKRSSPDPLAALLKGIAGWLFGKS